MDVPPPNTVTTARTVSAKPSRHAVLCTITCDDTTVELSHRRGDRAPHLVERYERTDLFHLGPILDRLETADQDRPGGT